MTKKRNLHRAIVRMENHYKIRQKNDKLYNSKYVGLIIEGCWEVVGAIKCHEKSESYDYILANLYNNDTKIMKKWKFYKILKERL